MTLDSETFFDGCKTVFTTTWVCVCLQAYHSSAYNHSKQPYKGSATDIPSPPGMDPPLGKPPASPRFKMELQMSAGSVGGAKALTSNDNVLWGSDDRIPCCHTTGAGTTTSPRDSSFRPTGSLPYCPVDGVTRCDVPATNAPPLVPVRTCSKNITLANMQASSRQRGGSSSSDGSANSSSHAAKWAHGQCDPRSASQDNLPRHQERLRRTSNENICVGSRTAPPTSQLFHSSDDLNRVPPGASAAQRKSLTIGPINCSQSSAANRAAVPYTRSNTTPLLVTPGMNTGNHVQQGAPRHPRCRSNYYYPPRTAADPRMQVTSNGGDYACRDTKGTCWQGSDAPTYGLAVSYPVPTENVSELPKSYSTDFDTSHSQHAIGGNGNRYSMPPTSDRTLPINLVTERMKKFESMDSVDSNSSVGSTASGSGRYQGDAPKVPSRRFGCDSVATRAAQYEHMMSDDEEYVQREQLTGSLSQLQQRPNRAAPATINIYFRSESPQHPILQLDRSPHRPRATSHSPRPATRGPRLNLQIQRPEMGHRFAARQPSYLTAIHSPKGECYFL